MGKKENRCELCCPAQAHVSKEVRREGHKVSCHPGMYISMTTPHSLSSEKDVYMYVCIHSIHNVDRADSTNSNSNLNALQDSTGKSIEPTGKST